MQKNVKNNYRTTTVTLDGSECEVIFDSRYNVFSVTADSDVTVALESGRTAEDGGVMVCKGGESIMYPHMRQLDRVYITGSGTVRVFASNAAVNPFKKRAKGGDKSNDFGCNFGSHNILADYDVNSNIVTKKQNGDIVEYTVAADKPIDWYHIATSIPLRRGKMYKLSVENFTGYGRLAVSSHSNGGESPYGTGGKNVNLNTIGNFENDNHLIASDNNTGTKYFYVVSNAASDEVKCGLWICTDANREGENGTNSYSFKIGLYEEDNKGHTSEAENKLMPVSEGLTAYFDYRKNVTETGWTSLIGDDSLTVDRVGGYYQQNSDSVAVVAGLVPVNFDLSTYFTVYTIVKLTANVTDWFGIFAEYGATPQFNLCAYNKNIAIGTGASYESYNGSVSALDYHICTMVFYNGVGNFYIDGQKVHSYSSYRSPISSKYELRDGSNFKMIAIFENDAQTPLRIEQNTKYLAQKYGVQI